MTKTDRPTTAARSRHSVSMEGDVITLARRIAGRRMSSTGEFVSVARVIAEAARPQLEKLVADGADDSGRAA